jgi:excisionase family DNA binding protein
MVPVTPATPLSISDRLRSSEAALSVSELAPILNVTTLTVHRWCAARRIPHFRIGRTIRFSGATVARWLHAREIVPAWFREAAA